MPLYSIAYVPCFLGLTLFCSVSMKLKIICLLKFCRLSWHIGKLYCTFGFSHRRSNFLCFTMFCKNFSLDVVYFSCFFGFFRKKVIGLCFVILGTLFCVGYKTECLFVNTSGSLFCKTSKFYNSSAQSYLC